MDRRLWREVSTLELEDGEDINYLPYDKRRRRQYDSIGGTLGGEEKENKEEGKEERSTGQSNIDHHQVTGDFGTQIMTRSSSKETGIVLIEFLNQHPMFKSFAAGSFSATCSTLLFQPFDLLKTRIQSASLATLDAAATSTVTPQSSGRMFPIIVDVIKNEQLVGLWRGTGPSLIRTVPGVGLHFTCLDTLQSHFCAESRQPSAFEALAFGMASRSIAGALLIPVTVVKTRFESGVFDYRSLTEAIRHIYHHEGARGLTSGLMATLARDVPFSGIYFMFYTQLKRVTLPAPDAKAPAKSTSQLSTSLATFACGISAGVLASVVTQPMDVVKTHMQLNPRQYATFSSTVIAIMARNGTAGLFAGMLPRLIRRTMMASMAWTVYEQMMKGIGLK